jgi:hypothetical protein
MPSYMLSRVRMSACVCVCLGMLYHTTVRSDYMQHAEWRMFRGDASAESTTHQPALRRHQSARVLRKAKEPRTAACMRPRGGSAAGHVRGSSVVRAPCPWAPLCMNLKGGREDGESGEDEGVQVFRTVDGFDLVTLHARTCMARFVPASSQSPSPRHDPLTPHLPRRATALWHRRPLSQLLPPLPAHLLYLLHRAAPTPRRPAATICLLVAIHFVPSSHRSPPSFTPISTHRNPSRPTASAHQTKRLEWYAAPPQPQPRYTSPHHRPHSAWDTAFSTPRLTHSHALTNTCSQDYGAHGFLLNVDNALIPKPKTQNPKPKPKP